MAGQRLGFLRSRHDSELGKTTGSDPEIKSCGWFNPKP
jgi:hypothetical protein